MDAEQGGARRASGTTNRAGARLGCAAVLLVLLANTVGFAFLMRDWNRQDDIAMEAALGARRCRDRRQVDGLLRGWRSGERFVFTAETRATPAKPDYRLTYTSPEGARVMVYFKRDGRLVSAWPDD